MPDLIQIIERVRHRTGFQAQGEELGDGVLITRKDFEWLVGEIDRLTTLNIGLTKQSNIFNRTGAALEGKLDAERAKVIKLRKALLAYHKVTQSIPYAQWSQEAHLAAETLSNTES